jgi:hypothetical protein
MYALHPSVPNANQSTQSFGAASRSFQTALQRDKATVDKQLRLEPFTEFSGRDAFQQRVCSDRIANIVL